MTRYIPPSEFKLLYGKSAGRCNICNIEVFQNKANGQGHVHFGEMAHNIPYSGHKNAPRAEAKPSVMDKNKPDNSYSNLILLCANHHYIVDQDTKLYSYEYLNQIKTSMNCLLNHLLKERDKKIVLCWQTLINL